MGDRQGGEHDGEVGVDGFALCPAVDMYWADRRRRRKTPPVDEHTVPDHGLGEHHAVGRFRIGMLLSPLADHVGHLGQVPADDETPAGVLDIGEIGLTQHARIGDHRHPGDPVRGHEPLHQRDHRLGLGPGSLERIDHQRHPGGVGEQPHGDLRIEAPFLGEPRLAEVSVSNHSVVTSCSTRAEGPSAAAAAHAPDNRSGSAPLVIADGCLICGVSHQVMPAVEVAQQGRMNIARQIWKPLRAHAAQLGGQSAVESRASVSDLFHRA